MKQCTDKEWKHCQEEKRTCVGCFYDDKEEEKGYLEALEFLANVGGRTLK